MNYKGKKVAITGSEGFIGKALFKALKKVGADVYVIVNDVRNPKSFTAAWGEFDEETPTNIDHSFDYLFHLAAPSSEVLFQRNPRYCADVTLNGFINAAQACGQHGIRLIYPSTGLLSAYESTNNLYANMKRLCEKIAAAEVPESLGLRIFATYGEGEYHKRDYASVPYLFARDMVAGREPVVFGDGHQTRDFIYIDDAVEAILHAAEECPDKILDIGSGAPQKFNQVIKLINETLFGRETDRFIEPDYKPQPTAYVQETAAIPTRLYDFYKPQVTFEAGIKRLVEHLKEIQQ